MHPSLSSQQTQSGPQILVVGNDQDIHKLLNFFLTQAGYRVISASPEDALNSCYAHQFDLVLLDLMLAPTGGLSFCQQLRRYSDVPLIALTEVNQPEQVVRGLELGADDAIHYPFAMVELMARMQALLRRRQWTHSVEGRLAGKPSAEADTSSAPIWARQTLSLNKSAFASGL
jgi:DNA-binding response OmpR family regulator